jgi:Tfp pilus assembly protein PilV
MRKKASRIGKSESMKMKFFTPERKLMNRQKKNHGLSLVELLVSFSLVTLLITGTLQLAVHSLLIHRNASLNLKTSEFAASLLEYLKSLPFESEELKEVHKSEVIKEPGSLETFRREWRIEDITANLKKVEVECFSESHPQRKTGLVLYLSRELGF